MLPGHLPPSEVLPIADELFARCAPRNERFGAAFSRNVALYGALLTGDVRRAVDFGLQAARIAQPLHDYFTTGTMILNLAWAHGVAGHVEEGRRLMDALVRSVADAGPDVDVVGLRLTVGRLHLWAGDLHHQALTIRVDHGLRTHTRRQPRRPRSPRRCDRCACRRRSPVRRLRRRPPADRLSPPARRPATPHRHRDRPARRTR